MSDEKKPNPMLEETIKSFHDHDVQSKYKPEYIDQVYKYALLGLSEGEIAPLFDVCIRTIANWKNEYPAFLSALLDGKDKADANVAKSLYDRAIGYEWFEEIPIKVKVEQHKEEIVMKKVKRFVPPDVGAMQNWLTNRKGKHWKNRQTQEGNPDAPIQHKVTIQPYKDLSDDELAALEGIADKLSTES